MRERRVDEKSEYVLIATFPCGLSGDSLVVEACGVVDGPGIIYCINYHSYSHPTTTMVYPNEKISWNLARREHWEQYLLTRCLLEFLTKNQI